MDIDIVIIGINCARTLHDCVSSVIASDYSRGALHVIYADGGSTDGSLAVAAAFPAVRVLALTPEYPAPGLQRNAGWRAGTSPLVLFMDADTTLHPRFIAKAAAILTDPGNGHIGAVYGTRHERHPEASIYNWFGDLEWNPRTGGAPHAMTEAFGGDVMMRRSALEQTGGYDDVLVGGEDPELGVRMRQAGWAIRHESVPMTVHDLAAHDIVRHARRAYRTGYGYAAVALRHAGHAKGFWLYELVRIMLRGGGSLLLTAFAAAGVAPLPLLGMAVFLLLYPRLCSVGKFMRQHGISRRQARTYAWHCALVVLPQMCGALRFACGYLLGKPLRNSPPRNAPPGAGAHLATLALALCCALPLVACSPRVQPKETPVPTGAALTEAQSAFPAETKPPENYATPDHIVDFSRDIADDYLLGPGDVLALQVWNRDNLSDPDLVVAPDGTIAVMRVGRLTVEGRSLQDVTQEIATRLSSYYDEPEVRLVVRRYKNNKAYVLGRVTAPGLVEFSGKGRLLEALSMAGALPIQSQTSSLIKCAIIRGKNQVIWIDLRDLLQNGNLALNARIRNNDIIFIPESEDELIYVMGEVKTPGAIPLKTRLTYLDALMFSGGPTRNADLTQTYIIRFETGKRTIKRIDLKALLEQGDGSANFVMRDNDIIYVSETGMASFNYTMSQIMPSMEVLNLGTSVMERMGIMQDLRRRWYGTEGFVNGQ